MALGWKRLGRKIEGSLLLVLLLLVGAALAADAEPTSFARIAVDADEQPRALQMAIVRYVPADGSRRYAVDLVSAIHIGDASYYAELNERFAQYDAVLYELVAPRGMVVTRESEKTGFVSGAQQMLTGLLELSFQLDEIDYTAGNFVHADLSGPELAERMAERDESLYTYFWRIVFATIRDYARDPLGLRDWQMLATVVESDESPPFKTLLALEVSRNESIEEVFGDDADSAVIGARNERAIEVLRERLDGGDTGIAIFYGVGHMPDLEERLLDIGLERSGIEWIDAWQLQDAAP